MSWVQGDKGRAPTPGGHRGIPCRRTFGVCGLGGCDEPPAVEGARSVDSPTDTRARGRSASACRVDVVAVDAPVSGSSLLRAGRKPRPIDGHTRGDLHRRPVSAEVRLLRAGRTLQAPGPWPRRIYWALCRRPVSADVRRLLAGSTLHATRMWSRRRLCASAEGPGLTERGLSQTTGQPPRPYRTSPWAGPTYP